MESLDEKIEKLFPLVGKTITLEMFKEENCCHGDLDEGEYWTNFMEEAYLVKMIFEGCYGVGNRLRFPSNRGYIQFFTGFDVANNQRRVVVPALLNDDAIQKEEGYIPLDERYYKNFPSGKEIHYRKRHSDVRLGVSHCSDAVISIRAENPKVEVSMCRHQTYTKKGPILMDGCYPAAFPSSYSCPWFYSTFFPDFSFDNEGIFYYKRGESLPLIKMI